MANFTPSAIDALRSGRLNDPKSPGLFIEALASGKKVFRYARRVPNSARVHKERLGPFPTFTIPDARDWAAQFNAQIDRGVDPVAAKAAVAKASMTVADAWDIYIAAVETGTHKNRQRRLKPRTVQDKKDYWRRDIEPAIGSKQLVDVTSDMLWDIILEKGDPDHGDSPIQANRVAAELKVFFKFCCMRNGSRAIGLSSDPASGLSGSYFEEKKRQRFLSQEELGWLLRALATEQRLHRRAILLFLLTGCRKSEGVEALTSEYRDGDWLIPAERSKNSQALLLPLSPWARSIFAVSTTWLIPSPVKWDGPSRVTSSSRTEMRRSWSAAAIMAAAMSWSVMRVFIGKPHPKTRPTCPAWMGLESDWARLALRLHNR